MGGPVVRRRQDQHLGHRADGGRDAERRRRRRCTPRRAAGRVANDDVHGVAGPAAHDSEHVQDRGRAHLHGVPHCGAGAGGSRAVHFRRPLRRHGRAFHRFRHAVLQLRAGSDGHGLHRAGSHPRIAHSVSAFLRRLPHLARSGEGRTAHRRRPARHDRHGPGDGAPRPRPLTGPSCDSRHGAEPGRLFPGAGSGESVLPSRPDDRAERDGQVREGSGSPVSLV